MRKQAIGLVLSLVSALLGAAPAFAAGDAVKSFNLPAADATVSLQQFSEQSGEQIVYPVDTVRGVTTNAVSGQLTARDALDQMLAGTELAAAQDAQTGALTVTRRTVQAATGGAAAPAAPAPTPGGKADSNKDVVQLETFVVTGSNLPTALDRSDVPITVVSPQDIEHSGVDANMLDVLRKVIPAFAGRSDIGTANATNSNQQTAGGSQIQLRNMETLVLVDGRRIAVSGANGVNGGKNFVDVSGIPMAAVDHIEVLTDGASAIYGSDAVGGVINFILKSDYNGGEIGGRYAISPNDGNYSEKSGYVVAGTAHDGVSVTVTGSWSTTDPLWQSERPFIDNNFQVKSNFPGEVGTAATGIYFLAPGLTSPSKNNPVGLSATATSLAALAANGTYTSLGGTAPSINLAPYQTILLQNDDKTATVRASWDIVPKYLTVYGDYMVSDTRTFQQSNSFLNNISTGNTVPAGSPFDPLTTAVANVVVGSTGLPEQIFNHSQGDRASGGFKGAIGNTDWNWDVGGVYSQQKLEQQLTNVLFKPNLAAAIAGGYNASGTAVAGGAYSKEIVLNDYPDATNYVFAPAIDPFARSGQDPNSLANLYGTEVINATSILKGVDAKIFGSVYDLPAGKVQLAAGAATRQESLASAPDYNGYFEVQNWLGGIFFDPFSHSRTIDSFYAETRIPVTSPDWNLPAVHALDLSLAGRQEKYSDAGTSSVPKIGLRWQPIDDQLTMRFTYSKAFAAPDLWHEYGPESATQSSSATFFSTNLGVSDPRLNQSFTYFSGNGNNPNLQPNHAWSRSLGLSFAPHAIKGLLINVDYIDVFEKGIPAGIGAGNIVSSVNALGSASPYFSAIAVGGIPGTPGATQAPLTSPNGIYNLLVSGTYQGNLYILDHFVNSGGIHEQAFDINPQYVLPTHDYGTFTIGTTGTYLDHFLVSNLPTLPFYEFAGYSTNTQTEAGTFPKWSFYTSIDWSFRQWNFTIGDTYMSSMTDVGAVTNGGTYAPANYLANHPAVQVNYYTSWDLELGYTFDKVESMRLWSWLKGTHVAVGVNDVFNRYGPYAGLSQAATNNYNNVDTATYSPIGRLLYVSASVKF